MFRFNCQLSPQTAAARNKTNGKTSGSSHLFSQIHKFGNTRGNCSEQSERDGQTAATALFTTAREEHVALFYLVQGHSNVSRYSQAASFIESA